MLIECPSCDSTVNFYEPNVRLFYTNPNVLNGVRCYHCNALWPYTLYSKVLPQKIKKQIIDMRINIYRGIIISVLPFMTEYINNNKTLNMPNDEDIYRYSNIVEFEQIKLRQVACPNCTHTFYILPVSEFEARFSSVEGVSAGSVDNIYYCLCCGSVTYKNLGYDLSDYHNYYYYTFASSMPDRIKLTKAFSVFPLMSDMVKILRLYKNDPHTFVKNMIKRMDKIKFKFELKEIRQLYNMLVSYNYPLAKINTYSYLQELENKYKIKLNKHNTKFLLAISLEKEEEKGEEEGNEQ